MNIKKIGIMGCGVMGAGIAQVILQSGYEVVVNEPEQKFLMTGMERVEAAFAKIEKKKKLTTQQIQDIKSKFTGSIDLQSLSDCDLVIEAVIEDLQIKQDLFKTLDHICKSETMFASNTSSLSITQMASVTKRSDRFLGLHFFNPVPLNPLVEVIKTPSIPTSKLESVLKFIDSIGKVAVVAQDNAGFIVNMLITPFMLDAMRAAGGGLATVKDIDIAMKLGCNHPMGPLMLADFIGLDVIYKASNNMFDEYKDSRYAAPSILKRMVLGGKLGLKTKNGFYNWSDMKNPQPVSMIN